ATCGKPARSRTNSSDSAVKRGSRTAGGGMLLPTLSDRHVVRDDGLWLREQGERGTPTRYRPRSGRLAPRCLQHPEVTMSVAPTLWDEKVTLVSNASTARI